jgi:PleD family two-component response regulator
MREQRTKVLVIDDDPSGVHEIQRLLDERGGDFIFSTVDASLRALDEIYSNPPDIVLLNQSLERAGWKDLCKTIKADTVFGYLPIVLILQLAEPDLAISWDDIPVDDYLRRPLDPKEMRIRIPLNLSRTARVRDINPLSRLPGNYAIIKEIQNRIDDGSFFAVGYVDLDHFKVYNDKYGFVRGDEVIKMTARLITNALRRLNTPEAFVGHVGGDDFIFIAPPDRLEGVCQEIIENFDMVVGDFYDENDRAHGYIESIDRRGKKGRFPIMPISIAVVTNEYRPIRHIGEVGAIAAEIKNRVKSIQGSTYAKDMRGSKEKMA